MEGSSAEVLPHTYISIGYCRFLFRVFSIDICVMMFSLILRVCIPETSANEVQFKSISYLFRADNSCLEVIEYYAMDLSEEEVAFYLKFVTVARPL